MVYLAIWLFVAFTGLGALWARRQARAIRALEAKLQEHEARSEKIASYVQRAMEDTYVLSTVMTERGHLEPEALERGRERLLKRRPEKEKVDSPPETSGPRTLH